MGMLLLLIALVRVIAIPTRGSESVPSPPAMVLAIGAYGEDTYREVFTASAHAWLTAAAASGVSVTLVGQDPQDAGTDREQLQQALSSTPLSGSEPLWLVFLGHGTFDGKLAKFNLRGPDVSAQDLAEWLKPFQRPLVIINTSSASGPFLSTLSASNRIVITATRSGNEQNFARFGQYLSETIADPGADLDKDGQTSLLEAFLVGSRKVREFYEGDGRLVTEHALLDDNGDALGTPADWFRGIRAIKRARDGAALDGLRAHQQHLVRSRAEEQLPVAARHRRDQLEVAIANLREQKTQLPEPEYYQRLEGLLVELARIYEGTRQTR